MRFIINLYSCVYMHDLLSRKRIKDLSNIGFKDFVWLWGRFVLYFKGKYLKHQTILVTHSNQLDLVVQLVNHWTCKCRWRSTTWKLANQRSWFWFLPWSSNFSVCRVSLYTQGNNRKKLNTWVQDPKHETFLLTFLSFILLQPSSCN
jgi:hypothetical protein